VSKHDRAIRRPFRAAWVLCLGLFAGSAAMANSLAVLHQFSGTDGTGPTGLVRGSDGNFYGATTLGGDLVTCNPDGCGTLFTLDPLGNFGQLHIFNASDGYNPNGLTEGPDGRYYGTAYRGGQESGGGSGVIFSITPAGKYKVLYRFTGGFACCDGASPRGRLLLGKDGMFYGTTEFGGDFRDVDHSSGFGTIFRFNPKSAEVTILHSFNIADANGIYPNGPLIRAHDGFLYGTTRQLENGGPGGGTLFRIDRTGANFSLVATLAGMEPLSGVIQGTDGNFYGLDDGGAGAGTFYRVDGAGTVSILNKFDGFDGRGPRYQPTQAGDGRFYGSTVEGGLLDFQTGAIFRMTSSGDFRILHSFASARPDGILPNTQLVEGGDGMLYGTAALGGTHNRGTVFRIDPADLGAVKKISVKPAIIKSGQSAKGTVTLHAPAPAGGLTVTLSVQSGPVIVPGSVKVREGQTRAKFDVQTFQIGAENNSRLYAGVDGQGVRTVVTVEP
jgi:uncharacterized repeat protein (TIGR03803 family)